MTVKSKGGRKKKIEEGTEWVRCLGWCNKYFLSRDRCSNHFCPACDQKRKDRVLQMGGIKTMQPLPSVFYPQGSS